MEVLHYIFSFMSFTHINFSGNSNLVYTIIRKRQVFHSLANLPCDYGTIAKSLTKRTRRHLPSATSSENIGELPSMEGSRPALPAEPGTLKATLPDTPGIVMRMAVSYGICFVLFTYSLCNCAVSSSECIV
jgi:hypothetical protein